MATIVKRPEGTYRAQIRRKGFKPVSAAFAKRQDAVDWAQKTEAALIERRFFPERKKHTLSEAIARYTQESLPKYRPGTAEKKRQVLAWWETRLGKVYLSNIDMSAILRELAKGNFAPATHNAYAAHLSKLFTTASRKWGWMQSFPSIERFYVPKRRIRILHADERERLLAACKASRSPNLYAVVFLALMTGGRYREILRLRWEDIDLDRGYVTFWVTKNGRVRSVPLTSQARELLTTIHSSPYLFASRLRQNQSTLWRSWDLARKRAGLRDFRFHDLRHTFASYLAKSGASLFDIGELLGYRKMESTLIYLHMIEGHTRKVVDRMAEEFFSD